MNNIIFRDLEPGKQIKIAMIALGISNKELAAQLSYKESTICDVLKGRNRNPKRIKKMWDALFQEKEQHEQKLSRSDGGKWNAS